MPQFRLVLTVAIFALLSACNSSSDDSTTTTTSTVPDAPAIAAATAGDASASIAFTAPTDNGGALITSYEATCVTGTESLSTTGASSPITVTGLTNDTAYNCSVTATNSVGTSSASSSVSVTPVEDSTADKSTADVECMYSYSAFNSSASVNLTSSADWFCDASVRTLSANGIPDHDVGTFPSAANPNTISEQAVSDSFTLTPVETSIATTLGGPRGTVGYVLNGVKIDPGTAGTCNDAGDNCSLVGNVGSWSIEALGQDSFDFGDDDNHAHVQPTGEYHYHGMPEGFITRLNKGTEPTLIAWAADGFPIYARYGYVDPTDATSGTEVIEGSYQLKATPDASRPDVSLYAMGTFSQDYEYVEGSGDLDECNGRTGVTPEFPDGIYHYYATDSYPFLQRCVKGTP